MQSHPGRVLLPDSWVVEWPVDILLDWETGTPVYWGSSGHSRLSYAHEGTPDQTQPDMGGEGGGALLSTKTVKINSKYRLSKM